MLAPWPWIMLRPSAERRAASRSRSGGATLSKPGIGGSAVRMTVLESASGAQKTVVSVALSVGATSKLQPPSSAHNVPVTLRVDCSAFDVGVVALVVGIAPQPFPCEVGSCETVDEIVGR